MNIKRNVASYVISSRFLDFINIFAIIYWFILLKRNEQLNQIKNEQLRGSI